MAHRNGRWRKIDFNLNRQEGQMRSSLIAVVLFIFAQACIAGTAADAAAQQPAAPAKPHTIKTHPARTAAAPGAELITTAAAGTRDAPVLRPVARVAAPADEDQSRPAGPAMLLAALALMSGIALRRYGAGNR